VTGNTGATGATGSGGSITSYDKSIAFGQGSSAINFSPLLTYDTATGVFTLGNRSPFISGTSALKPYLSLTKNYDGGTFMQVSNFGAGDSSRAGIWMLADSTVAGPEPPTNTRYLGMFQASQRYTRTPGWGGKAVFVSGSQSDGMQFFCDAGNEVHSGAGYATPDLVIVGQSDTNVVLNPLAGNIGIGTLTPNYKLQVHSTGGLMQITNTAQGSASTDGLVLGSAGDAYFINRENTDIQLWANNAERFKILSTGGSRTIDGANGDVYHYVENTTNGTASRAGIRLTDGAGFGQWVFAGSNYTIVSPWASSMVGFTSAAGGWKMVGNGVPISFCTNTDLTTASLTLAANQGTATFSVSVSTTNLIAGNKSINTTSGDASTQNAMAGRFRKDNSGTTFTLTNSFITANSIITLTPVTAGLTGGKYLTVQAGTGSAIITFEDATTGVATAPSADMDINFQVTN